jgi:DNA-binding NarL/FixJ family response regulator
MDLRVFLVEDVPLVAQSLGELLPAIGGMRLVGDAASEADAKAWMDSHRGEWDVILVDLMLLEGTGLGVIRHAKAHHAASKVAVLSGFLSPRVRAHCQSLGVDAIFSKSEFDVLAQWLHAQIPADAP